ncbi:glycosyltransferase [Planktomarina temperata]|nr:glycosyltransferase [Planktomarina temperata]
MQNKDHPLISVVMPTYNHAEFLKRALASIVSQKYSHWEVIVIDNHSKDHTDEVINSFKTSKIKFVKIKNNGVIGASRNLGIKHASGEWIAFMDSDDLWYQSRLSACAPFLNDENDKFDIISTDEMMVSNKGNTRKILRHGPASANMYRDMILYGNRLSPSATIVRKSFLERKNLRFSEDLEIVTAEDYDFWLRIAQHEPSFMFLNSVEGEYTIHSDNTSNQVDKHISAIKSVLKEHVFELQKFQPNTAKLWRHVRSHILLSHSLKEFNNLKILKATSLLFMSVLSSPVGFTDIIFKRLWQKQTSNRSG